jgi:hypothetical protein
MRKRLLLVAALVAVAGSGAAGALKPGSYWYQPGGALHGDACLSDECVIFLSWEGPRDVVLPPAAPAK